MKTSIHYPIAEWLHIQYTGWTIQTKKKENYGLKN